MTLIAEVFPKLQTPKNLVISMSKKFRLNWSFGKQHGKRTQTLLKFKWQYLYHIYWSLWRQLNFKRSLLVTSKISRLFPNTLSADSKGYLLNRDNLMQPIQMQLSQKQETFSQFFFAFLKFSVQILNIFRKKIADVFLKLRTKKKLVRSMPEKSRFNWSFKKQHGRCAQMRPTW